MDKLERLKVLLNNPELEPDDESIVDTLKDMANYCIMEVIERKVDLKKQKEIGDKTSLERWNEIW